MKKLILSMAMVFLTVLGFGSLIMVPAPAYADISGTLSQVTPSDAVQGDSIWPTVKKVLNVIMSIVGVIAVIILIISGVMMMTSQGDPGKFAKARNGVLYSAIGLVVALLSFAIVNFVVDKVG